MAPFAGPTAPMATADINGQGELMTDHGGRAFLGPRKVNQCVL